MEFLTKAHSLDPSGNNTPYIGWLMSRKYNGFSLLWDGGVSVGKPIGQIPWGKPRTREDRYTPCTGLWTSDGHIVHAPEWWYLDFPKEVPLQGEAWYNDSKWYASVCNCTPRVGISDSRWKDLKFIVYNYKPYSLFEGFALEQISTGNKIFTHNTVKLEHRLQLIYSHIYGVKSIIMAPQVYVTEDVARGLGKYLDEVTCGTGWEGVMLANPTAMYDPFRTSNLLKLKPEYDIEVEVVGYSHGERRHVGRMGALLVKLTWDDKVLSFHGGKPEFIGREIHFNVGGGFTDSEREWDYVRHYFPLGSQITITFNEVGEGGAIPSGRRTGR